MKKCSGGNLSLSCEVCAAPASDHLHFGGKFYNITKIINDIVLINVFQPTHVTPAANSSEEHL